MNTRLVATAGVVLAIFAYLAFPFFAVASLMDAARKGDADRLASLVDFPALRSSLKDQLNAATSSDPKMRANPFAALAPVMMNALVDSMINPSSVAKMIANGEPVAQSTGRPELGRLLGGISIRSPFEFRLFPKSNSPKDRIELVFVNSGLANWQLREIRLPAGINTKQASAR